MHNQHPTYEKFTFEREADALRVQQRFHKIHPNVVSKLCKTACGTNLFVQRKLGIDTRDVIRGLQEIK